MNSDQLESTKIENQHLAEEHGLIKTTAYIRIESDRKRSSNAKRVAKHRQQKKALGIVPVDLPISVATEIKDAGSFEAWISRFEPRLPKERIKRIRQLVDLGKKVEALPDWVRWLLKL